MTVATLAETIKSKQGGLATASAEELAAQQGRTTPSRQPLETAVLGGSPQQAAMAARTKIQESEDLSTRIRRSGTRQEQSAAEKQQLERGGRLEQLGGLDTRVQQLADQRIQEAAGQDQDVQLQAMNDDPEVNALLSTLTNPEATPQQQNDALFQINQKLGKTQANEMLTSQEIQGMFGGQAEAIGGALVLDAIETGELPLEELGFSSVDELTSLLGADVSQMNVTELLDQVNSALQEEHSQVEGLEARIDDPRLGAAERAESRKQLRDLGVLGVRSAESDLEEMADSIAEADTVEYGGETVDVSELLSNDYMSGLIKQFMTESDEQGKPVSQWAKDFASTNPELTEFVTKHQTVLNDAMVDIGDDVANFAKVQESNADLGNLPHGEVLDDNILAIAVDGWGEMSATEYRSVDPETGEVTWHPSLQNNTVIKSLYDDKIPQGQRSTLLHSMETFGKSAPAGMKDSFIKQFMELDETTLHALGAFDHGNKSWQDFTSKVGQNDSINNISPDPIAAKEDISRVLGLSNSAELDKVITDVSIALNQGDLAASELPDIPGLLEGDTAQVTAWLVDNYSSQTFEEMIQPGGPPSITSLFDAYKSKGQLPQVFKQLPPEVANIFRDKKSMGAVDAVRLLDKDWDASTYGNTLDKLSTKMDPEAKAMIQDKFNQTLSTEITDKISSVNPELSNMEELRNLANSIELPVPLTADATFGNQIREVQGLLAEFENIPGAKPVVDAMRLELEDAELDYGVRLQKAKDEAKAVELGRIEDERQAELDASGVLAPYRHAIDGRLISQEEYDASGGPEGPLAGLVEENLTDERIPHKVVAAPEPTDNLEFSDITGLTL